MEAKTKALELKEKFGRKKALLVVEEVLNTNPSYEYWNTYDDETPSAITFWYEVKAELEKK